MVAQAILISGATGFLGSAIAEELVLTTDARIYALVRSWSGRAPLQRLKSLWHDRPVLRDALESRIVVVDGDVTLERLGMDQGCYDKLSGEVDAIVHAAAEVRIDCGRWHYWDVNVRGTYHMLEFARQACGAGRGLGRFVHISTAYVAGTRDGMISEALHEGGHFNSLYEWSKHEAELLVSSYDDVPYAIVRPAQIVGDSRTGFISTFNTLYYPLKLYMKGAVRMVPASRDLRVNMVPVDYVAHIACRAIDDEGALRKVMHAVTPANEQPTIAQLVDEVRMWARENMHVKLPDLRYLPVGDVMRMASAVCGGGVSSGDDASSGHGAHGANGRAAGANGRAAHAKRGGIVRNMALLAPYFAENRTFENARANAVAGNSVPNWRDYLPRLLQFAVEHGFLNRTERTVYEQVLMRLRPGASTRIDYFDVGAEGMTRHAGTDVRTDMASVAAALRAWGVKQGDRVATIGVNSVRYCVLDTAIGLVGAVNVPLYYTSPTQDVYALVQASGACVLFAGTDRMLDDLDLSLLNVPVIAMSNREDVRAGVTTWRQFTALGDTLPSPGEALEWVDPAQLATIRFTSGTTGNPKGVTFDQGQVRWMGEVMPAVLDWRTRNARKLRYLSFLPMSHVVEGILVAYAPYYILSDIEMYYLNDFSALADALPRVRPNLFFSVPRFYEKVWNQFASTGPGRLWISLPEGVLKRVLAAPLRFVVLRKAGLDRCRQLIVGSAPIGMDLLEAFRSLGIEVHNAFGVTEAPLITLSRLDENELGSVGRLLPQTQARIGDDGQVYVRGPQVTRGYYGMQAPAVDGGGWFCTGDLAAWSPAGNLVLQGRKKEIMVTSYGKNIAPNKIETMLKGIECVSEAMVVADGKPFTTALIWLEEESAGQVDFARIDRAVLGVNEQLSHPEQVKRWIVAAHPLSVSEGELTPNLKVRRGVVAEKRADLLSALYDGWDDLRLGRHAGESPALPAPEGTHFDDVLHAGEAR